MSRTRSVPLYYSTLIAIYICVHFTDVGRVKDLPGPVTGAETVFHRALLTAIAIVIVVVGFAAVILGVLWKKYGKNVYRRCII